MLLMIKDDNANDRRMSALYQMIQAFLDIPFVISFFLLSISLIHIYTIRRAWEELDMDGFRKTVIRNALKLPFHIPITICSYWILITGIRIPTTLRLIKKCKNIREIAMIMPQQAFMVFMDVIALIAALFTLATIWRAKIMWQILKENSLFIESFNIRECMSTHMKIFRTSLHFLRDIPILILMIIASCSIWRVKFIYKIVQQEATYKHRLVLVGRQSYLAIADWIALPCAILCLLSWRTFNMQQHLRDTFKSGDLIMIFKETKEVFIDLPYILVAPLALWRLPSLISELRKWDTALKRRDLVIDHIVLMLSDIPIIFMTCSVILSIYRTRFLVRYILDKKKRRLNFEQFISYQMEQLIADLPLIAGVSALSIVVPWRFFSLLDALFWTKSDSFRRKKLENILALASVDGTCEIYSQYTL